MAYTAGDTLIRAVMQCETGLPADAVINDFAFDWGGAPTEANFATMCGWVADFYEDVQASTFAVGNFISDYVDRGATHELQAWTITAGPLGSPDYTQAWIGPPAADDTNGLPSEVAGVLSFHADLSGVLEESGATRPRARRRGRVYIGPLIVGAVDTLTPPFMLDTTFRTTLQQAAVALKTASTSRWSVWSRADATLYPVQAGWTDNAPDTQRRRGPAASNRTTWGP